MSITADYIVELFEKDARARRRLAELLISEPDVRLAIVNAVIRDVATKADIEKVMREIEELRRDVTRLGERVARLEGAYERLAERIGDLRQEDRCT